jgi:hypothetical protein
VESSSSASRSRWAWREASADVEEEEGVVSSSGPDGRCGPSMGRLDEEDGAVMLALLVPTTEESDSRSEDVRGLMFHLCDDVDAAGGADGELYKSSVCAPQ